MEVIDSADGTSVAYEQAGEGPPLVLIHGTAMHHTAWQWVHPILSERFTLYMIDRRGRGQSGDADEYTLEREIEDVLAVINTIEEPVGLLGHSFGALLSLEVARQTTDLRGLILYEPPISVTELRLSPSNLWSLLEDGKGEQVTKRFLRVVSGGQNIEEWTIWPDDVVNTQNAYTVAREVQVAKSYKVESDLDSSPRTLLLVGEQTHELLKESTAAIDTVFSNNSLHVFERLGHGAMINAPERFSDEVIKFFSNGDSVSQTI